MRWRLRNLLALQNVLIALIPLLAVALLVIFWIAPQLRTEIERHHLVTARTIAREMAALFHDIKHELELLLYLPTYTRHAGPHWQQALDENTHLLQRFNSVLVVNRDGKTVAVGLPTTVHGKRENYIGTDISRREFFTKAFGRKEAFWSDTYISSTTGQPSVAQVLPLPEGGLLVGEVSLTSLSDSLSTGHLRVGKLSVMLIDSAGVLIAHPDGRLGEQQLNLSNLQVIADGFIGISKVQPFVLQRTPLVGTAVPIEQLGWLVLVGQPPDAAYWLTSLTREILILALAIALLVSLLGGFLLASYEARRFDWYENIANNLARGRFEFDWPQSRVQEFYALVEDLRKMAAAIQMRERRLQIQRDELQTYRDQLESKVKRRTDELNIINKELESFSYSVSHDLRAPLRAMDGFSSLLLEEYGDVLDEQGINYLKRIKRGCDRMAALIENMLHLSRLNQKELNIRNLDLSVIARQELANIRSADPDRKIKTNIQPTQNATGDPNLMSIAIKNLLDNAWKYTCHASTPFIEFGDITCNGQTVYYVQDNGAGFDMNYADKLFGAFQRLHREDQFPGDGIGLATVKRIITRHGGMIWADAEADKGAIFYFTLPRQR